MQFTEVLTRDEKAHLSRFVTSFEQEYALSDEFQVVSLARTLELGGFTPHHREIEKKPEAKKKKEKEPTTTHEWIVMGMSTVYFGEPEDNGVTDWNVPKLALAPVRFKGEVTLSAASSGYKLAAGKWAQAFKPSWHTPQFPNRGRAGLNLYETTYAASLPPLPREAQSAVNDFGAGKCLVLWEADWEKREQYLDPAILVPVWRDLYSVVYTWDLTEAERAALKKASANP